MTTETEVKQASDQFYRWFVQQVQEIHGFDLREPLPGPAPAQVTETAAPAGHM